MKVLIAVISYDGDALNGAHQAIRDTWGKDVLATGADLKFFIGRRCSGFCPKDDEVLTPHMAPQNCEHAWYEPIENCCLDYWQHLNREMLRWSVQNDYDFTFLCCNDTFIVPRKLITSGFEKYDYSGYFIPQGVHHVPLGTKTIKDVYGHKLYLWADAGVGWFMSKKAAKIILEDKPDFWTGDIHIGQTLGPLIASGEISAATLEGFWNNISWHYRIMADGRGYNPTSGWQKEMYEIHGQDGLGE